MNNSLAGYFVNCIYDSKKNRSRGIFIDVLGYKHTLHAYTNLIPLEDNKTVYEVLTEHKQIKNFPTKHYEVMLSTPKKIAALNDYAALDYWKQKQTDRNIFQGNTKLLEGIRRYEHSGHKIISKNKLSWDELDEYIDDVQDFKDTKWTSTYKEVSEKSEEVSVAIDAKNDENFIKGFEEKTIPYGNKASHLLIKKLNKPDLENLLQMQQEKVTVNNFKDTGVKVTVDNIFLQVAMRERQTIEVLVYFAIVAYFSKARKSPTTVAKLTNVKIFLKTQIDLNRRNLYSNERLFKMHKLGMIHLRNVKRAKDINEKTMLEIRSQQVYVTKKENANIAQARAAFDVGKGRGIAQFRRNDITARKQRELILKDKDVKIYDEMGGYYLHDPFIRTTEGKEVCPIDHPDIYNMRKPYFTFYTTKTMRIDSGFTSLLNSSMPNVNAWFYEMIISSWEENAICRTSIQMNLGITKNTQHRYEQINKNILRRSNFFKVPQAYLMNRPNYEKEMISANIGKKYRISANGHLYRQEGNSYKSSRFQWKNSSKCCKLRLTRYMIKLGKALQPVFYYTSLKDGKLGEYGNPEIRIDPCYLTGSVPQTFANKKTHVTKKNHCCIKKDTVATLNNDTNKWKMFNIGMMYDQRNGNLAVPNTNRIKEYTYSTEMSSNPKDHATDILNVLRDRQKLFELSKKHFTGNIESDMALINARTSNYDKAYKKVALTVKNGSLKYSSFIGPQKASEVRSASYALGF